jgi:ABC-type multidrug transport system ATPase subunit
MEQSECTIDQQWCHATPRHAAQTAVATAARIKPPMQQFHILQNISGVLKPGRLTLLLGPPGGGKSIFMKALCGAAPVALSGDITYNGAKQSEFNVTRTARYVDQFDLHNAQLTVRETLTFSAMCQGEGYNRSAPPVATTCCGHAMSRTSMPSRR